MWPSLLYGCPGQRQEVAAETLERSLCSLIFRPSIRPCHTPAENCPGAPHPTENKTQLFTMHMRPKPPGPCHSHQPCLPHWPLQATLASCGSSNKPSMVLSQGLCTCCSLDLEHTSLNSSHSWLLLLYRTQLRCHLSRETFLDHPSQVDVTIAITNISPSYFLLSESSPLLGGLEQVTQPLWALVSPSA